VNTVLACVTEPFKANEAEKNGTAEIQAAAELARGLLAYQKPDTRAARKHFGRAMALQPKLLLDRGLMSRYVKSLLGARLLAAVRRTRQRRPGALQVPEQPEKINL
jgi:hypothetical protein